MVPLCWCCHCVAIALPCGRTAVLAAAGCRATLPPCGYGGPLRKTKKGCGNGHEDGTDNRGVVGLWQLLALNAWPVRRLGFCCACGGQLRLKSL